MLWIRKMSLLGLVVVLVMVLSGPLLAEQGAKINLNTATVDQLVQLKNIGMKYAERIVKYREENGPFKAAEDLLKVPGIGVKTFELNKDRITVD